MTDMTSSDPPADPAVKEMLVRLSADSNEGVRMSAKAALMRMSKMWTFAAERT